MKGEWSDHYHSRDVQGFGPYPFLSDLNFIMSHPHLHFKIWVCYFKHIDMTFPFVRSDLLNLCTLPPSFLIPGASVIFIIEGCISKIDRSAQTCSVRNGSILCKKLLFTKNTRLSGAKLVPVNRW